MNHKCISWTSSGKELRIMIQRLLKWFEICRNTSPPLQEPKEAQLQRVNKTISPLFNPPLSSPNPNNQPNLSKSTTNHDLSSSSKICLKKAYPETSSIPWPLRNPKESLKKLWAPWVLIVRFMRRRKRARALDDSKVSLRCRERGLQHRGWLRGYKGSRVCNNLIRRLVDSIPWSTWGWRSKVRCRNLSSISHNNKFKCKVNRYRPTSRRNPISHRKHLL